MSFVIGVAIVFAASLAVARVSFVAPVRPIPAGPLAVPSNGTSSNVGARDGLPPKRHWRERHNAGGVDRAALAEIIDLFGVALQGGHNLSTATRIVAAWTPGAAGDALTSCCRRADQGERLSDALDQLPVVFDAALGPLVSALVAHDRYGAPVATTLTLLARDARQDQRRAAEVAARRLPVVLLFPLVLCVLPSFLLLTVVPLAIEALSSFEV